MSNKSRRYRMDFELQVESADEKTRTFRGWLLPDPERYEWRVVDGKKCLYDKLDNMYLPEDVLRDSAKGAKGLPIYYQPPLIEKADEYLNSRRKFIHQRLNGKEPALTLKDKSEDFLEQTSEEKLGFVILSIDVVGSTRLAETVEAPKYASMMAAIMSEFGEAVTKFHGHVLKYTGDGIIAYFPEPSFVAKNDLALNCAQTLLRVVQNTLNPVLKADGFPPIEVRIGIESGDAYIKVIGSPETKQHKDILGAVVNMAVKIQALAGSGEIYLGETVLQNLHTTWRKVCAPVELDAGWTYRNVDGNPYRVFKVNYLAK